MSRSARSNVGPSLTLEAFESRPLAAVKAFLLCARSAMPFARLSDVRDAQNAQINHEWTRMFFITPVVLSKKIRSGRLEGLPFSSIDGRQMTSHRANPRVLSLLNISVRSWLVPK